MKVLAILLAISYAAATLAVGQQPERDSVAANEVRNQEHSKFDALQHKDYGALDAMFDDALLWVDYDGSLWTKAQYLANLRNPNWQVLRIVPETMTVQVFGDAAIVVGIYAERGLKAGHPYQHRCRFIDTWMFKKGKWVCIAATATSAISQE